MDNNEFNESDFGQTEAHLQQAASGFNSAMNGFEQNLERKFNQKDVEALSNRGNNGEFAHNDFGSKRKKKNDDLTDSGRDTLDNSIDADKKHKKGKNDDLTDSGRDTLDNSIDADKKKKADAKKAGNSESSNGEKDSEGKSKDDKSKDDKAADKASDKASEKVGDKVDDAIDKGKGGFFSKLWLKIKAKLIIYAIILGIILIIIIGTVIAYAFTTIYGSFASFFGISEDDTTENLSESEADGLLTKEEYLIDPDTGDVYADEDLVKYLKENSKCTSTTLGTKITDWFDWLDGSSTDVCTYFRFINNYIEKKESEGYELDRGLILSTLFYGYVEQPAYYDYVDETKAEDTTSAFDHYESLVDILKDGGSITKSDVIDLIDNSILDGTYIYYEWVVEDDIEEETETTEEGTSEETTIDEDTEIKKSVGKCVKGTAGTKGYSLYKWQIFMRFGEEAAEAYEDENQYSSAYLASDEECREQKTDAELKEEIQGANTSDMQIRLDTTSINEAHTYFKRGEPSSLAAFAQVANIRNDKEDVFTNFGSIEISYKNGFAYINFPAYKDAFSNPEIDLAYDKITTPKAIEDTIQLIIDKKADVNYNLGYTDLDSTDSYYTQVGSYAIGKNCEKYLTAAVDSIQVKVTDCDGRSITTTTFKDYIMGVAYGEVGSGGENYVKSEMTAAISYALNRRSNYSKGTTITMKSGNCDQVYCPMSKGCHAVSSSVSCGSFNCTSYYPGSGWHSAASQSLIDKFSAYYDDAKQYLLVANNQVFAAHYVSTIQNNWKAKADRGLNFTQIIQEQYQSEGAQLIKCTDESEEDETTTEVTPTEGTTASSTYPNVSYNYGKLAGFAYSDDPEGRDITINPAWVNANIIEKTYDCDGQWKLTISINKNVESNYNTAMNKICDLVKTGVKVNGTTCKYTASDLLNGDSFEARTMNSGKVSLHAYGVATDFNYSATINVNGTNYTPYSAQGSEAYAEYQSFVSAIGGENNCKNVNYILWKYAFEPAGFEWGGNWESGYWDGMHFEVDEENIK